MLNIVFVDNNVVFSPYLVVPKVPQTYESTYAQFLSQPVFVDFGKPTWYNQPAQQSRNILSLSFFSTNKMLSMKFALTLRLTSILKKYENKKKVSIRNTIINNVKYCFKVIFKSPITKKVHVCSFNHKKCLSYLNCCCKLSFECQ